MAEFIYGLWDGDATVMNGTAWYFDGAAWVRAPNADVVFDEAAVISKVEFDRQFPNLPPPPAGAFLLDTPRVLASE
jgi:hypothetical protein